MNGAAPPAARLGDTISHEGVIVTGSPDVFVEGPPSARLTDEALCDIHDEQSIVSGSLTVLVNGLPKARIGDSISCEATIVTGAATVLVGG
jgi:uncharacterized Zn-binding protein involved in type VI secretion